MDVEMEKRKFLNLCGKRDRALLSGEKRMTLGGYGTIDISDRIFLNWRTMESPYGKNLVMM